MKRSMVLMACLALGAATSHAFDFNDCIINGMKGVSSDVAAGAVRTACRQKLSAFEADRKEQLMKEYGEPQELDTLEGSAYHTVESPAGFYSSSFLNTSHEKTVRYIRLVIAPAPGGPGTDCDFSKRKVYAYSILLKPKASHKLVYPSATPANCLVLLNVFAKTPTWRDVSLSSSSKPIEKDPFAGLE